MVRVITVGDDAVGSGSFEPIPVGTKLKVALFDIKEGVTGPNSKKPGSPQFEFTVKVTEDGQFKGREIRYNYITLDPAAAGAWALAAFSEAVGWKVTKAEEGEGWNVELPDNLTDALGTEFIAKIGQTSNPAKVNPETGKPYVNNRVTGYAKLKAGAGLPAKPDAAQTWGSV